MTGREGKYVGSSVKRREDQRFLVGRGLFNDDIKLPNQLYAAFLRSPYAHAKILNIDLSGVKKNPKVKAVITGEDVKRRIKPWPHLIKVPPYYGIAVDRVRYVGEPVVALAAETRYDARDALEEITVDYEPLPPVYSIEKALSADAPLIHEGFENNIAWHRRYIYGEVDSVFAGADKVIRERFYFHRFASTPLEPTSLAADYNPASGELTIYDQNQQAPMYHARYARVLGIESSKIRVITRDIGGGFGNKIPVYPYTILVSLLSMEAGRPVKWTADRREDLMALMHSPDRIAEAEAAVKNDGQILGIRLKLYDNFGAYLRHPEPQNITRAFPSITGCYQIKAVEIDAYGVFTNTCPTGPNRGYGQQHSSFILERMVDIIAEELKIDKAEIRFRNFIRPEQMPYTTPLGSVYDGGDYPAALRKAMEMINYDEIKKSKSIKNGNGGRYVGVGLACIVEGGATNFGFARLWGLESNIAHGYASAAESALVKMLPDASVVVALGTVPQGQGHETTAAQIVADILGVDIESVKVMTGFDSLYHPYSGLGSGTYASRFSQIGVGALVGAASKLREKMLRIAAHRLETRAEELEIADGRIYHRENPSHAITIREVARIAHNMAGLLPPWEDPGLESIHTYHFPYSGPVGEDMKGNLCSSYANLAGAAVVSIDAETGFVRVEKLVIVHDAGKIINPMIVEGQVHGAAAHGLGGALYEAFLYDADGQLLTSSFMDYLAPTALEIPDIKLEHMESPSPFTPLGSKGCGEGATILLPVLIANAVEDALREHNIRIRESHITPEKLWRLINKA